MALPTFVRIVDGWPTINVGMMRHQITVYAQGAPSPPTYDSAGVSLATWQPFISGLYAAMGGQAAGPGAARQGIDIGKGDEIVSQLPVSIAIWYQAGIEPNMRVKDENGSTYVIQNAEDVLMLGIVMVLTCVGIGSQND